MSENEQQPGVSAESGVGAPSPSQERQAQYFERQARGFERQALGMAAAVFVLTMACWGGAQFACNKRPTQYKQPQAMSHQELAGTPKDAAIELRQLELKGDLAAAIELADGPLLEELKQELSKCAGNCANKGDGVLTRAEVLHYDGPRVVVRTISLQGSQESRAVLRMERRGPVWKAVERTLE